MSVALKRGLYKSIRTVLQLVVSGGFTALINEFASGLSPAGKLAVSGGFMVLTVFAQNTLETAGTIPILLPSPAMPTSPPPESGALLAQVQQPIPGMGPSTYAGPSGGTWTSDPGPSNTGMSE